jgi:uncharacterized protein (TIGR03086 family)
MIPRPAAIRSAAPYGWAPSVLRARQVRWHCSFAGILSIEFLVHAWDYAIATGQTVNASDAPADYVLGLARQIITPRGRGNIGFDRRVPVSDDVSVLDPLIAFTGRQPVS